MLRLEAISYRHPGAVEDSLHDVSLELPGGTVTGLAGPSESGISSLCLVAGGLAPRVVGGDLAGEVSVDGEPIAGWPMHRVAEVVVTGLADPAGQLSLIADTVLEEVAFGPANVGLPREVILERAGAGLDRLGIASLADRDPRRLSTGQQQLVVMAGLMAMGPRYLILDAPLAHLDGRSSRLVLDAVTAVAASGVGVLLADQHVDAIASICDALVVLAGGRIVAQGPPAAVLADPALADLGIDSPEAHLRRILAAAGLESRAAAEAR